MTYPLASIDLPAAPFGQEHIATMTVNGCAWEIHWPFTDSDDGARVGFLSVRDEGEEKFRIHLPDEVVIDTAAPWFSMRTVIACAAYELLSNYSFAQGGQVWHAHSSTGRRGDS
ncbi:hypothetical protein [Actinomyces faecalis]|uniref:hypothetical protein n=1 Tax=Actinomyces faecalis TaxID=2722820 RepID=UPI001884AF9A|nr:hypothetical protein [Actinomyces faecalis]